MISTKQFLRAKRKTGQRNSKSCPRIALLTPYSGGNFGDAAIQDSMIANLDLRLAHSQLSGISLNCENFSQRHRVTKSFPLLAHIRLYGIFDLDKGQQATTTKKNNQKANSYVSELKKALKRLPLVWRCVRLMARWSYEAHHFIEGFRFLRTQDLLVMSGGGQLNEEYEGPWRHPFGLFKWAVMARMAGAPLAVVSVGVGKVTSMASRLLISATLSLACYRSYRDNYSKKAVTRLLQRATSDPVVLDLAFSLPSSKLPAPADVRALAHARTVIAISPIAIGKPAFWPTADLPLYNRYLREMAELISQLLKSDYFLVLVTSCLDEDQQVIPELLGLLDDDARERLAGQMHIPAISTWQEFVATLRSSDLLIASRLHSIILGFMSGTPAVAISVGAKVNSVMTDFGQTDHLLQVRDFTSKAVLKAVSALELRRDAALQQIASRLEQTLPSAASQYDTLVQLAVGLLT